MMINSTKTSKDASAISIHKASTYSRGPTLTGETSLSMIRVVLSFDIVLLFSLVALSVDVLLLSFVSLVTGTGPGLIADVSFLIIS